MSLAVMSQKYFDEDETIRILARRPTLWSASPRWTAFFTLYMSANIGDGIGKLDASIKAMKEESDAKFEELKQLILGTSTHVDHVPQTTKSWDVEGSNKLDPRKMNDMIGERFKLSTDSSALFVDGMQPTDFKGFGREFGVDPQAAVDREMQHVIGTNQTGERVHRGARTNQAGDRFVYHKFEHRMRKLKMPVFEGEDAYGWIYRVERYFEIQGIPQHEQLRAAAYVWKARLYFHSWNGFKRRLLIQFQQSQEGNLYEQFLAITQE
ncbi:hypothetical protein Tco_1280655 [Tanacetum coccineum]